MAGKGKGRRPARAPRSPREMDAERIVAAIRRAESATTGEIRIHVTHRRVADALASAADQFHRLGMERTHHHNAVLIYVAPRARRFAVFGDTGIHEHCGDDFWRAVVADMEGELRAGRVTEGILRGIERLGETLAEHFPRRGPEPDNELPDTPTTD